MSQIPDSGDPGDVYGAIGMGPRKPELLTEATWRHLTERFQLRGEIGSGGQAVVFEAKEVNNSHRKVALKVYHENTDAARRAFENECRWLTSSHLPQELVVGYHQCESGAGLQPYLVLEFLDKAHEIQEYVQSPRPMTLVQRIDLFEKYLRVLQRFHDCNVVIGDVSARNVMVQPGDKIKLLDLAGAKLLSRGHTGSQSSLNIGTPGQVPIEVFTGDVSTSRATDLIAAASVGFRVLTNRERSDVLSEAGLCDENHDDAPQVWDRELARHQVPAAIRRVLLKGLRKPDPRLAPDARVYGSALQMADDIATWRARQARLNALWKQSLVTLALVLLVAIPGVVFWNKFRVAEAAADLKVWQSLQAEIRELPNLTHPAVTQRIEAEKRLIAERDDLIARNDPSSARAKLAEMLVSSRDTLKVAREIERASRLREAIGKVLLDESASFNRNANGVRASSDIDSNGETAHAVGIGVKRVSGFWVTAAPVIDRRLVELQRMYQDLAQRIAAGDVERLSDDLGILQERLVELFKTNLEAQAAFDARSGYEALQRTVPERLRSQDGFRAIASGAQSAEQAWSVTKWDQGQSLAIARSLFGVASQQLDSFLEKNESVTERTAREKNSQERVAQLEAEGQKLQADYERKADDVRMLNEQIAKLTQERLANDQKLTAVTNTLAEEQKRRQEAESKVVALNQTTAQLAKSNHELDAAKKTLAEEQKRRQEAESKIAPLKQQQVRHADGAQRVAETGKPQSITQNLKLSSGARGNTGQAGKRVVVTIDGQEFPMRFCPPGNFKMGTQVEVTLTKGFWMLETEVTQGMYQTVKQQRPWLGTKYVKSGASYPAVHVSWNDANDFCQKLTIAARRAGTLPANEKFTLPTEAQWVYAARAGTTTADYFGNDATKLDEYAWYEKNSGDRGEQYAHQVGLKKPNPWGLFDMTGNVWEWCSDWYDQRLSGGVDPRGPTAGSSRVLRGGSFASYETAGTRFEGSPATQSPSNGFRVVRVSE